MSRGVEILLKQKIESDAALIKSLISHVDLQLQTNEDSLKDLSLSAQMLTELKKQYPDDSRIRLALGKIFKKNKEAIKAIEELRSAIILNNYGVEAYLELSYLLPRKGALQLLQKAINSLGNDELITQRYSEIVLEEILNSPKESFIENKIIENKKELRPAKAIKQVVFIAEYPRMRLSKIAGALRENGWEVVLICLHRHDACNWSEYFDHIETFSNPEQALSIAAKYNPQAYHVFTGSGDLLTLRFVQEKLGKTIVDFYDYGEGTPVDSEDISMRAYRWQAIESADGIVVRDIRLGKLGRELGINRPEKIIFFPEYCGAENINIKKETNGIHLVSCGFIANGDSGWGFKEAMEKFLDQGLFVHVYPHPMQYGAPNFKEDYQEYFELEKKCSNFKLHSPVKMENVVEEISKYHFGISVSWDLSHGKLFKSHAIAFLASCNSARNIDYLDAGLGVILSPQLKFQKWLLDRFEVAVSATPEFFNKAGMELASLLNNPNWKANINRARQKYSVKNNISRLENFYREI